MQRRSLVTSLAARFTFLNLCCLWWRVGGGSVRRKGEKMGPVIFENNFFYSFNKEN